MIVEIDKRSGFCFGVVNAISRAERSLLQEGKVYCLGDIVHNRLEVQRLEGLGLTTISRDDMEKLENVPVLIRAHGEPPSTYELADHNRIKLIDATCPVVAQLQHRVKDAYVRMEQENGQVVILGKKGHAEVVGLAGQVGGNVIVIENIEDLDLIDYGRPVYLLSQTTQSLELFGKVRDEILGRSERDQDVTVIDTICRQVSNRENHLREFAARYEIIIFVSGKKSSNGKVLYEICRNVNPRSYNIEEPAELDKEWFGNVKSVGVCGATSTPEWLMENVAEAIKNIEYEK